MASMRETLLDVMLSNTAEEQISGNNLFRLGLACNVKKRQSSAEHAEGLLSSALNKHTGANDISGLLLVYPSCLLLCVEGQLHNLHPMLEDLCSQDTANSQLQDARVILSMEGLPQRCCRSLYTAFIPSSSSVESAEPAEPAQVVKLASSATGLLRKVGSSLSLLSEYDVRRQLSSIATYYEDLPAPETLLAVAASSELPTGREWLAMNRDKARPDMHLDSELEWPMAKPIKV